jgi:hypothetical protein
MELILEQPPSRLAGEKWTWTKSKWRASNNPLISGDAHFAAVAMALRGRRELSPALSDGLMSNCQSSFECFA